MTGEPDNVDWSDAEKLKADLYAVLCERNEMATEITELRAKIERLTEACNKDRDMILCHVDAVLRMACAAALEPKP
jgi:predicted site-specific integrase-resolvase